MSCRHRLFSLVSEARDHQDRTSVVLVRDCNMKTYRLVLETGDSPVCADLDIDQVRQLARALTEVADHHEPWA